MTTTPETHLLKIDSRDIQIGDTLLALEGEAVRNPRIVLSVETTSSLGPDLMTIQLANDASITPLLRDSFVVVRRPATAAAWRAVVDQLLLKWRDAHFAAQFGGADYTSSRACKELSHVIWQLEGPATTAEYDEYDQIASLLERTYEGTDELYFQPPC